VNLSRVAEAVGFKNLFLFWNEIDFSEILNINESIFVHVKVEKGNADVPVIDIEPEDIKSRFIEEVKGR